MGNLVFKNCLVCLANFLGRSVFGFLERRGTKSFFYNSCDFFDKSYSRCFALAVEI